MKKQCKDKFIGFCDYVVAFDNILVNLRILPNNLQEGWLHSNVETSDDVCHLLCTSYQED